MTTFLQRVLPMVHAGLVASLGVACADQRLVTPLSDAGAVVHATPAGLVISEPLRLAGLRTTGSTASAAEASAVASNVEVVYVSLPSGSLPSAVSLTIRNVSTGTAPTPLIPIRDGGFDPVAVVAGSGHELELKLSESNGAITLYRAFAPMRSAPGVVRTSPASGANDVPLNSRITVVFTEPIAPLTLTPGTMQVWSGSERIPGSIALIEGSTFAAEFVPDAALLPNTPYRVLVTRGVRDVVGDSLGAEVQVSFTTERPGGSFSPIRAVAAGVATTCALRADGKIFCWGANRFGQLGAGNDLVAIGTCAATVPGTFYLCRALPSEVLGGFTFASIGTGFERTCGLTTSGAAVCWGRATPAPSEETPVACDPAREKCDCDPTLGTCNGVPVQVPGALRFTQVVSGYAHSCGVRVGGGAYCWGSELFTGLLGTGSQGLDADPLPVYGAEALTSLASGSHHACGLTASGAAYCWGLNLMGQIGSGAAADVCQRDPLFDWRCAQGPVLVDGGHSFASLVAGWSHSCGLTMTGRAYCWGDYIETGSFGPSPSPVSNDLVFTSLSDGASASHTCGVTPAHDAYCWGNNDQGQLGDGSTVSTRSPVRVSGELAFSSLTTGLDHTCGVTREGEVYCWGANDRGQLGVGRTSSASRQPIRALIP